MPTTIDLLQKVSIFKSFNQNELEQLSSLFKQVAFAKGETVCREGEAGDCFYIIESGELEVLTGVKDAIVIDRMGTGEFFGEIALLEEGQRSATIQCLRNARLLQLSRDDFDAYFLKNPKALLQISKLMGKRLVNASRRQITPRSVTVIAVQGPAELKGKSITALALALLINQFSKKKSLCIEILQSADTLSKGASTIDKVLKEDVGNITKLIKYAENLPPCLRLTLTKSGRPIFEEQLSRLIEILKDDFTYLVFDIQTDDPVLKTLFSKESDYNVAVVNDLPLIESQTENGAARFFPLINRFNGNSPALPVNHMMPFILPKEPKFKNAEASKILQYIQTDPLAPFSRPLHRLARKILGITIGLALGGGAAFGIANVGVIKEIESSGIPIDLIAGTSMGSIVAMLYATGSSGNHLTEMASKLNIRREMLTAALDVSLTKPGGLLSGNQVKKIFSPFLNGAKSFEDLVIPCRTVATDIETGERIAIKDGRLDDAFNASSSVPILWCPVNHQGRILVDGAITDPVPAEVIREMGADICIAINVVPPVKKGVDTLLNVAYRRINQLNPFFLFNRTPNAPNMFGVIMNAIQTLQYELGNFKAISADVLINPDLSEFTWIEFYRANELIEKGRQAALDVLPEIKQAISMRLSNAKT